MRFFIGFKKNAEAAAEAFADMLQWREKNDVNEIRRRIMGGLQPHQFPRYAVVRRFYPLLKTGTGAAWCWAAVCCCRVLQLLHAAAFLPALSSFTLHDAPLCVRLAFEIAQANMRVCFQTFHVRARALSHTHTLARVYALSLA